MSKLINSIVALFASRFTETIALLVARLALAGVFWRSARSKIEDGTLLSLDPNALYQFTEAPFNQVPFINGEFGAYVTTYSEHALAILLILGLFTRFGALGLFIMTMVIQTFVFTDMLTWWGTHSLWAGLALVLVARGGGWFAMDRLIGGRMGLRKDL